MECRTQAEVGNVEYLHRFGERAEQLRIPLSGSLELTKACNLACIHCYIGSLKSGDEELSTGRVLSLIDEVTEAGCLDLLVTGGEPLLRHDFSQVYRRCKEKGILVTVFTNGTLITEEIADLWAEYPPSAVEISLHGVTASTYEAVSGVKGSYGDCLKGIGRLVQRKISLRLKTVLMTVNLHELPDIRKMAKELGAGFRSDAALFPRFDGDRAPLDLRVTAGQAVEDEFSESERADRWRQLYDRYSGYRAVENLYACGAGVTAFHIDACGMLSPCLMTTNIMYNCSEVAFIEGWKDISERTSSKKIETGNRCFSCTHHVLCGYCPAFFGLENGDEQERSEYLCTLGRERLRKIASIGNYQL